MPAQSNEAQYLRFFCLCSDRWPEVFHETEQYYGMRIDKYAGGIPMEGCEGEGLPVIEALSCRLVAPSLPAFGSYRGEF